jgi:cytochrome oxidase Cu insertion factor (SCO1/SenC/PrrC family)
MTCRQLRWASSILGWALMLLVSVGAAGAGKDVFAAMRAERVVPPVLAADLVLRATDGSSIRLGDFKGKVVAISFLLTN